jgi:ATP phosphoribosyltransferase
MTLKIAVQKSGRLLDDSLRLLKECGIDFNNGVNKLRAEAMNYPLEILFLRDDDIPQYVEDSVVDAGIVGENVLFEKGREVQLVERLGFARCRLSIAVPKNEEYTGVQWLQDKKIATSYPAILLDFLSAHDIESEIHEISGSVEIAPGIGLSDAICDLVSSGSTLFLNGLKEVETVMISEAAFISNTNLPENKQKILSSLLSRIRAVKRSKRNKYIMLNAPNEKLDAISAILPGMKSPSVLPLAKPGWSSLHSVVQEDDFWNIIENLQSQGAEGILVLPIEKMIV